MNHNIKHNNLIDTIISKLYNSKFIKLIHLENIPYIIYISLFFIYYINYTFYIIVKTLIFFVLYKRRN